MLLRCTYTVLVFFDDPASYGSKMDSRGSRFLHNAVWHIRTAASGHAKTNLLLIF